MLGIQRPSRKTRKFPQIFSGGGSIKTREARHSPPGVGSRWRAAGPGRRARTARSHCADAKRGLLHCGQNRTRKKLRVQTTTCLSGLSGFVSVLTDTYFSDSYCSAVPRSGGAPRGSITVQSSIQTETEAYFLHVRNISSRSRRVSNAALTSIMNMVASAESPSIRERAQDFLEDRFERIGLTITVDGVDQRRPVARRAW